MLWSLNKPQPGNSENWPWLPGYTLLTKEKKKNKTRRIKLTSETPHSVHHKDKTKKKGLLCDNHEKKNVDRQFNGNEKCGFKSKNRARIVQSHGWFDWTTRCRQNGNTKRPKAKEDNSKQLPSIVTKSQGRELKATTQHGHQKPRKITQSNYPAWSSYFEGKIQLSIESNPSSLWYCFTSLCDWSRRLTPPSQHIRYNTKTNAALDTCVFQHFMHFACILFNFTFSNYDANHHSDLVLSLLWI